MLLALICAGCATLPHTAVPPTTGPEDVAFKADCDGTEQRYVLVLPEGYHPARRQDVLMVFHGHGSDRWQYVQNPRDECRAARDAAAKRGMIFVSPDYRASTSWMGPKAEADTLQIIRELKTRHRVGRVFLCGGSMGATAALTFAARHPELIAGVAAMNGTANHLEYENFQDAIAESFGGTKRDMPEEYKNRSAEYFPERFTMPVGLSTGGQDTVVPAASVLRLAGILKVLGRDVLLVHREEGGHETNYSDATTVLDFVLDRAR